MKGKKQCRSKCLTALLRGSSGSVMLCRPFCWHSVGIPVPFLYRRVNVNLVLDGDPYPLKHLDPDRNGLCPSSKGQEESLNNLTRIENYVNRMPWPSKSPYLNHCQGALKLFSTKHFMLVFIYFSPICKCQYCMLICWNISQI